MMAIVEEGPIQYNGGAGDKTWVAIDTTVTLWWCRRRIVVRVFFSSEKENEWLLALKNHAQN